NGRDRKRQRLNELQAKERIVHRRHDVRTNAQTRQEHRHRNWHRSQQGQGQHESDRAGAMRVIRSQGSNKLFGLHLHCSRNFAVRLVSARCSATRTAPSLIANFAAVSLIEALSTAIDCNTSRWRGGRVWSWAAISLGEAVSAADSSGIVSAKSSILTNARRPRRRSASISLLRAIANNQGANGAFVSQVCRFRCTANKMSCTISSDWSTGCPARARPRRAAALRTGVTALSSQ